MITFRKTIVAACCTAAFTSAYGAQSDPAAAYPTKPIRFIVPFVPGAGTDTTARTLAQKLTEKWGQQTVVDNRTGAGGAIGVDTTAKAIPDGYTICLISASNTVNSATNPGLPYDLERDLQGITQATSLFYVMYTHPSLPVKTVKELIAYAKANPGKLNVGVPGNGTLGHITSVLLQRELGISMTDVPYRGTALVVNDLLGGQVDLAMDFMPSYVPLVREGKVRALAVTTGKRSSDLPDVNTVQDAGFPGFEATAWYALAAPAGTPSEIIDKLNAATNAFLKSPKGQETLANLSMQAVGGSPADLKAFIASELQKWGPVVKEANIAM
jgi:tripartite-type tricarboxylate transporter receptor subunit TctC